MSHEPELFLTREELETINRLLWQMYDQLVTVTDKYAVLRVGGKLDALLAEMGPDAFLELA